MVPKTKRLIINCKEHEIKREELKMLNSFVSNYLLQLLERKNYISMFFYISGK